MPTAAASAPPPMLRTPSTNGPAPPRQKRTAITPAEPTRGSERHVDPEQVVKGPYRPAPPEQGEHRSEGREREPRPRPRPASASCADDARGQDAECEERGEVRRGLDHEGVQPRDMRA